MLDSYILNDETKYPSFSDHVRLLYIVPTGCMQMSGVCHTNAVYIILTTDVLFVCSALLDCFLSCKSFLEVAISYIFLLMVNNAMRFIFYHFGDGHYGDVKIYLCIHIYIYI